MDGRGRPRPSPGPGDEAGRSCRSRSSRWRPRRARNKRSGAPLRRRGPCVPSPGTWRRKERERLAARLRDQSALCSEVMRRCCGGGGAGLGRVLGEGARAAARGGVQYGRGGRRARAPGWKGGCGPGSRDPECRSGESPPPARSRTRVLHKVLGSRTRGRAIAQALSAWALPWLWTRLRGRLRGAPARCAWRREKVEGRIVVD